MCNRDFRSSGLLTIDCFDRERTRRTIVFTCALHCGIRERVRPCNLAARSAAYSRAQLNARNPQLRTFVPAQRRRRIIISGWRLTLIETVVASAREITEARTSPPVSRRHRRDERGRCTTKHISTVGISISVSIFYSDDVNHETDVASPRKKLRNGNAAAVAVVVNRCRLSERPSNSSGIKSAGAAGISSPFN